MHDPVGYRPETPSVRDKAGRAELVATPAPRPLSPPLLTMPRRRRARWWAALLLVCAAAGTLIWRLGWLQPASVEEALPWHGAALEAVYATGVVEAVDTARVGTTVAGRISSLAADEGDMVQAGQLLAALDDRQARQRLEDARARLVTAQQDLARTADLIARGVRSAQQLEHAVQERDQAAAAVQLMVRQLDDYTIRAPLDAVVMKRLVEPGETLAANATLYELSSVARLRVAADVDERDIPLVRMGARVAIRADAFPREAFSAAVTNIRRQGETSTRTFRVEAALPAGTRLLIGMTVDVNVVVAERVDALLVPAEAIRHEAPLGGRPGAAFVYRMVDGRARRTPVETGAVGPQAIEVKSGLAESDAVIAAGLDRLTDGQRVRARPRAP
jgi:RND family efflux transporter MFP subunit